jgi:predicted SAM-dependent methyltransferase
MGKFHDRHYSDMARQFCKGSGLEIGSLHSRLDVDAEVRIVDFIDTETLKDNYKDDLNVNVEDIWPVDIVTNAWDLSKVKSNSVDFVMSSHVLEHLPNPAVAIEEWMRVVKPGGVVFFVVPDMRHTFDKKRKLTSVETLLEKYKLKTDKVPYEAYDEFVKLTFEDTNYSKESIQKMYEDQANIHVHTFTEESLITLCNALIDSIGFKISSHKREDMHIHVALTKNI